MIQPAFLKQGDTLAVIAPARKLDQAVIEKTKHVVESWGLRVVLGSNLFNEDHSYLSSTDEKRAADFQQMIDNQNVRAILCARGGYGSTRIIDQLDFSILKSDPKWVIGFSDITAIHLQLHALGLQTVHASMPVFFSNEEHQTSIESLRQLLFGMPQPLTAKADKENKIGEATGLLVGGNLSILVDSLGTKSEVNTTQKILVLEEVGEYFYKVDRMLVQLKRSGKLASLAGLVVGHFTDIKESTLPFAESVQQIIRNHTAEYNYPIGFNFPIGHEQPNLAWMEGAEVTLRVIEKDSTIVYSSEERRP
jgi:muramoyltetrapeptide carboxypeptidase